MGTLPQPELNEKLAAILSICQKMNSERDLGALLDLIAREATKLLDCDRASIFLLDRERNELWSKVALGSNEILRFDAESGIAGAAMAIETAQLIGELRHSQDELVEQNTHLWRQVEGRYTSGYNSHGIIGTSA